MKLSNTRRVKFVEEYEFEQRRKDNDVFTTKLRNLAELFGINFTDPTKTLKGKMHLRYIVNRVNKVLLQYFCSEGISKNARFSMNLKRRFDLEQKTLFKAIELD